MRATKDHIPLILLSLHWLPIKYRTQFKILLFLTYKALNGHKALFWLLRLMRKGSTVSCSIQLIAAIQ